MLWYQIAAPYGHPLNKRGYCLRGTNSWASWSFQSSHAFSGFDALYKFTFHLLTYFLDCLKVAASSSSACPPTLCTELTKYIVMNAVDIALSCARRAKHATPTDDRHGGQTTADSTSLIDAFINRLANDVYSDLSATARQRQPAVSCWLR